jgi:hypothetical protein
MSDPFREQRLHPREVRRFLERAFALAAADPEASGAEQSLTRDEAERAAAGLGLPPGVLARAWQAGGEPEPRQRFQSSGLLGAPTRLFHEIELDGEPGEDDREDLLDLIQRVTGEMGSMQPLGKTLTWQTNTPQGRGRQLSVRLRTRHGRTRVVIEERLGGPAAGLFIGLCVGGGIGPMGGYVAAIAKLGAVGLLFPLLWIPIMYFLARTIYVGLARRREAQILELLARIEEASRGWPSGAKSRVRVEHGEEAEGRAAEEAAEEEAEEEALAAGRARGR